MKVVILGGSGVFGSRLARLLARDGHELILAARRGCDALAAELGALSLRFERGQDPSALFQDRPDLLVDAAGPFQAYGDDPYALARAAIAAGVNYIDLSDDADFTTGIKALDESAKARSVYVLSGVSSVPALSSCVVADLATGPILAIDAAILPGNRAPRGRSVMAAILTQVGQPLRVREGGVWREKPGWSASKLYHLPGGLIRRAWLNRVPDLECFPVHFDAPTVTFRAGLELGLMGWSLAALSKLRQWLPVPVPVPLGLAHWAAGLLEPLGSDMGGMVVSVTQLEDGQVITRNWRLLAQGGDGPYVPAIPARAIVSAGGATPGARAALAPLPMSAMEAAMADLNLSCARDEQTETPLFAITLGDAFDSMPEALRDSHAVHPVKVLRGQAKVTRGPGLWPQLLARLFRFPKAGENLSVEVTKTRQGEVEHWVRTFAGNTFRSVLRPGPNGMTERFGPFTFTLGLHVSDGALHFPVNAGRLGPLPLPRVALPRSETREYVDQGQMCFDVTLYAPLTGQFIIRYEGRLTPVA